MDDRKGEGRKGRWDRAGLYHLLGNTNWTEKMEDKYVNDDIGETQDNFFYFLV